MPPAILAATLLLTTGAFAQAEDKPEPAKPTPTFQKDVLPILTEKCNRCHGAKRQGGKLDLRTREAMLEGGDSGPAFKVKDSKKSLLIELIFYNEMPPKKEKPRVSKEELDLLRRWIDAGAPETPKPEPERSAPMTPRRG